MTDRTRRVIDHRPDHRSGRGMRAGVAVGALVLAFGLATGCGTQPNPRWFPSETVNSTPARCEDERFAGQEECGGPTFEELRAQNLHYADRLPFTGDPATSDAIRKEVVTALEPLVAANPAATATPDEVRSALEAWGVAHPGVSFRVADNAVRTAGTAFGIELADQGGCVFGTVNNGTVTAEVGGYINDGGCLAVYAH